MGSASLGFEPCVATAFLSENDVTPWMWCRLFCTWERTISWLPCCSRNSSSTRHLKAWCSFVLSLIRFHTIVMIEENSTVNVPLA